MKTKATLLLIMILGYCSNIIAQEIPNHSFETWDLYNTWTYEPEFWQTSNNQLLEYVTMDSAAYEGELAMRITSEPMVAEGFAEITIPIGYIPDRLGFYVKTEAEGFPFFNVTGTFYYLGEVVTSTEWNTGITIEEWTYQELDFDNIEPLVDQVVIRAETVLGDFVFADGWMSLDKFEFMGFNSVEKVVTSKEIILSPNPANNYFALEGNINTNSRVEIYDLVGNLIFSTIYRDRLDVSSYESGIYLISYQTKEGDTRTKKFIKN